MNATDAVKKYKKLALSMARSAATDHVLMSEDDMFQEANIAILRATSQANLPTDDADQLKFVRSCILNAFRNLASANPETGSQFLSLDEEIGEDEGGNPMTRHDVIGVPPNQERCEAASRASSRVATLSQQDQELLQLTANGKTTREIAKLVGVSQVAIVKRLKKARAALSSQKKVA